MDLLIGIITYNDPSGEVDPLRSHWCTLNHLSSILLSDIGPSSFYRITKSPFELDARHLQQSQPWLNTQLNRHQKHEYNILQLLGRSKLQSQQDGKPSCSEPLHLLMGSTFLFLQAPHCFDICGHC